MVFLLQMLSAFGDTETEGSPRSACFHPHPGLLSPDLCTILSLSFKVTQMFLASLLLCYYFDSLCGPECIFLLSGKVLLRTLEE